jgi:hypothetical protein
VLGVGAPLGGRLCLQALKEAHGLLPNLLDASDLDCLLYAPMTGPRSIFLYSAPLT